jgi:ribosomal protein S18 acetylase RimI-like enzyme
MFIKNNKEDKILELNLHHNFSEVDLVEIEEIYLSVNWTKHTPEVIKQVFKSSNLCVFAFVNGKLAGFGRAMTDGVFNAAIYDVIVHPRFQRQSVAKRIMEDLLYQLKDVSCIHLISTTGNEGFYQKLGFKRTKTCMAIYLNPALGEHYLE